MKERILIFGVLMLLTLTLSAQVVPDRGIVQEGPATVLTFSGMNLCAEPFLDNNVIGRVPMGERIQVLSSEEHGEVYVDGIKGTWQKVSWLGQEGYLFNGYLFEEAPEPSASSLIINSELASMNWAKAYNWYGLYYDGSFYHFRPVQPVVTLDHMAQPVITTDQMDRSIYLFAEKDQKRSGNVKVLYPTASDWGRQDDQLNWVRQTRLGLNDTTFTVGPLTFAVKRNFPYSWNDLEAYERIRNQKERFVFTHAGPEGHHRQVLDADIGEYMNWFLSLELVGDLNQDGLMDFIIGGGNEKGGGVEMVWLSQSENGKLNWKLTSVATSQGC